MEEGTTGVTTLSVVLKIHKSFIKWSKFFLKIRQILFTRAKKFQISNLHVKQPQNNQFFTQKCGSQDLKKIRLLFF